MILLLALLTMVFTLLGGLFALKFKDKLHLVLGFSAGAVIGVAFFDLLPEALNLGTTKFSSTTITTFVGLGFLIFLLLDRLVVIHAHDDAHCENQMHRGQLDATSLSIHSFLDGVGIGLAFKVSPAVGIILAAAVLTHDFSDGINTVNVMLKNNGTPKQALNWLITDAVAPVVGVVATFFFSVPEPVLGIILALFTGSFLYIGASDLLPESHHQHPQFLTTGLSVLGMITLYIIVRLAS